MTIREFFKVENIPVFQNKMFDSQAEAVVCPMGDVVLAQNMETGLVSNMAFDPNLLCYDDQYQNEQSCSVVFRQHLADVASIIGRNCHGKTILEIGCGKGHFLELLRGYGYQVTGIDPAYEGNSPCVIKDYFRPELRLKADCVLLRHVLEHVLDPLTFLAEIAGSNSGKSLIYIEVPCFDWICRNRAWFDVFYEHVNYFSIGNFHSLFAKVHESGHLFGGQYLYIVADLASLRVPRFSAPVHFPSDFLAPLESLVAVSVKGRRRAIWGGAAKGMMSALYMKRAGLSVEFVIDINPAKQGRYLAGSGLQILPPSIGLELLDRDDEIFITNSNYTDEIVSTSRNRFRYLHVDHYDFS